MIMEDSIPSVADRLRTASMYFSTLWSLSFFEIDKREKQTIIILVSLWNSSQSPQKQILRNFIVPSHYGVLVAQFGIPPVSSVKDHSRSQ